MHRRTDRRMETLIRCGLPSLRSSSLIWCELPSLRSSRYTRCVCAGGTFLRCLRKVPQAHSCSACVLQELGWKYMLSISNFVQFFLLNLNFLLLHKNRYFKGMDDGQKTPRGHPDFNSYVKILRVLVFMTNGQTDR